MKPEAQLIALLEWMGARQSGNGLAYFPKIMLKTLEMLKCNPTNSDEHANKVLAVLPPLTLDLMREAEKKLGYHERFLYSHSLAKRTKYRLDDEWDRLHATKEQRLEALLKTIGKWEPTHSPKIATEGVA